MMTTQIADSQGTTMYKHSPHTLPCMLEQLPQLKWHSSPWLSSSIERKHKARQQQLNNSTGTSEAKITTILSITTTTIPHLNFLQISSFPYIPGEYYSTEIGHKCLGALGSIHCETRAWPFMDDWSHCIVSRCMGIHGRVTWTKIDTGRMPNHGWVNTSKQASDYWCHSKVSLQYGMRDSTPGFYWARAPESQPRGEYLPNVSPGVNIPALG